MSRLAFRSFVPLFLILAALLWIGTGSAVRGQSKAEPKAEPKSADPHGEDRAAIRAALESLAKAFGSGDAKGLAGHWTAEGEYHHLSGKTIRGRESLEKGFAAMFAKAPERKAEVRPQSIRFLSSTSAVDEGKVIIRKGPTEATSRAHYTALFVREEGKWRLAMLTESTDDEPMIEELGWLIGNWTSAGESGADILTSYTWDSNKKFIHVEFKVTEKDRKTYSGKQVIGIDPATGGIRSWTFESNGGVGETDWHPDGDHWELHVDATLPDGRELTETNVLRRINEDTFTWQSIHRMLGDVVIPDLAPVKVTRVKAEK